MAHKLTLRADARLRARENQFLRDAAKLSAKQAESLRIQLANGTSPSNLVLDAKISAQLAKLMAALMSEVHAEGKSNARLWKAAKFAAPDIDFLPGAGLDWYLHYTIPLAGVCDVAALDNAKATIAEAIRQGATGRELQKALAQQFTDFSKRRLENIARTETAKVYEQSMYQSTVKDPDIAAYEISAVLDSRTTDICRHRDGMIIPKSEIAGWLPPYHYQCRTEIVPVLQLEVDDGSVELASAEDMKAGPKPIKGFGTLEMTPQQPDRHEWRYVKRAEKAATET
jgi:SPP1 gp7 family putative phage head morphogenesis protein